VSGTRGAHEWYVCSPAFQIPEPFCEVIMGRLDLLRGVLCVWDVSGERKYRHKAKSENTIVELRTNYPRA